ncbi:UNVERIFIED_CONTAM: hypothetical protein Sindi_1491000 [Sesamum indicum]
MVTRGRASGRARGRGRGQGRSLQLRDENEELVGDHLSQPKDNPSSNPSEEVRGQSISSRILTRGSNSETQVGETIPSRSENEQNTGQSEGIVSHGRRRGPNSGAPIPDHPSKRTKVTVVNNRFIENGVTRNLTNDIKGIFTEAWPRWHAVPKASKDLLWENFKLRYWWDNLTDEEMRKVWNENASDRFKEMMYKAKQKALNDAHKQLGREPEMSDMIDRGPYWLNNQLWNDLVQKYWASEDYLGKYQTTRKNHLTKKDGSITKHTGGSIPVGAHRQTMEKELGREVTDLELFQRCHRKNKGIGEFINNKSKRISEEYLEKTGCTDVSSQSSFDISTWYDITGGPSKGHLYGFGCSSLSTSSSSISSTLKASDQQINELTKVVEEFSKREEENRKLLEIALEEVRKREEESRKREEEARKRDEEARKREADLQELVRKLLQDVGYTKPSICWWVGTTGATTFQEG